MHARKSTVKATRHIWRAPRQRLGTYENSVACTAPKIVSLFLVAMLQWATVLAVCPSLHELIHHDADDDHHDCAVTMLLAGQLEQPAIDPFVITKPALVPVPLDQTYESRSFKSFFLSCRLPGTCSAAAELTSTTSAAVWSNTSLRISPSKFDPTASQSSAD
jgi:hypothetical protein